VEILGKFIPLFRYRVDCFRMSCFEPQNQQIFEPTNNFLADVGTAKILRFASDGPFLHSSEWTKDRAQKLKDPLSPRALSEEIENIKWAQPDQSSV
jgi:hypothetical protein